MDRSHAPVGLPVPRRTSEYILNEDLAATLITEILAQNESDFGERIARCRYLDDESSVRQLRSFVADFGEAASISERG